MPTLPALFDLSRVPEPWRALFAPDAPWSAVARLDAFLEDLVDLREGDIHPTAVLEGAIRLAPGARIGPHAFVQGPAWIMAGAEVGHAAMIRGGALLAPRAKVGHASEVKHSVLLEGAQAPHFNYVGDSVLGSGVNLGAGVKLANLKVMRGGVWVAGVDTGLRKLGGLVGDGTSIGCNAVLAPGTVIGRGSIVYDGSTVRGVVPEGHIVKLRAHFEIVERRGVDPSG